MLPPLFPSESPKLDLQPISDESLMVDSMPAQVRSFRSLGASFWVIVATTFTMFGVIAFLAVGIVTSSPPKTIAHHGSEVDNSNLGSVYGTWTDLPQEQADSIEVIFNAKGLQSKIAAIINQHKDHNLGVVVAPVGSGEQVRLHDDQVFTGASTTKLLTAVAVLQRVDRGEWKMDRVAYELQAEPAKTGADEPDDGPKASATPTPSPTPTPEPKPVTIAQALQLMVNQSNNVAWEKLIGMIGSKSLGQLAAEIGMQDYDVRNNRVSPRSMALLLQKIYSGNLLSEASTKLLLSQMQHTNEERMIPAAITESGEVYHKYGWLGSVVHDVAVVDNFGHPVIVVLMSDGPSSFASRTALIRELAETVEQALREQSQ